MLFPSAFVGIKHCQCKCKPEVESVFLINQVIGRLKVKKKDSKYFNAGRDVQVKNTIHLKTTENLQITLSETLIALILPIQSFSFSEIVTN